MLSDEKSNMKSTRRPFRSNYVTRHGTVNIIVHKRYLKRTAFLYAEMKPYIQQINE